MVGVRSARRGMGEKCETTNVGAASGLDVRGSIFACIVVSIAYQRYVFELSTRISITIL